MPSFASGLTCCTAWASTCAALWRSTARPSGEPIVTGSTTVPGASSRERSSSSPPTRITTTSLRSAKRSVPVVGVCTVTVSWVASSGFGGIGEATSDTCSSLRVGVNAANVLGSDRAGWPYRVGTGHGRGRHHR